MTDTITQDPTTASESAPPDTTPDTAPDSPKDDTASFDNSASAANSVGENDAENPGENSSEDSSAEVPAPSASSYSVSPDAAAPDASSLEDSASLDAALESSETLQGSPIVAYDPEEDLTHAYEETMIPVTEGHVVTGTVVQVDEDEVLLDIGFKSEGVIFARELSIRRDVETHEIVKVGDVIEASVLHREDREGRLILSKKRAQYERAWDSIIAIKEGDGIVKGTVIEAVKGGLIMDVGLRGFLPASLVDLRRVRDLQPYLGQTLEAKILEIDKTRNNVVLSRREWLQESQREQREQLMGDLTVGEIRTGVVASIVHFGAFVDMGGMDGLVHVSELSWKHVSHPTDVVNVGDEVTVKVLEVDTDRERVSLSMKATQRDPWEEFAETHQVGELVYGRITKTVSFGAFVQVGEVVEGLVHISELATTHVEKAEQVVTPGEELWVKIVAIDLPRRRISLSIKQAAEGGVVAAEYQEHFGEHAYDDEGNYVGFTEASIASDADEAWAEYYAEQRSEAATEESAAGDAGDTADATEPDPQAEFTYAVRDAQPAGDEAGDAGDEAVAEEAGEEATAKTAEAETVQIDETAPSGEVTDTADDGLDDATNEAEEVSFDDNAESKETEKTE